MARLQVASLLGAAKKRVLTANSHLVRNYPAVWAIGLGVASFTGMIHLMPHVADLAMSERYKAKNRVVLSTEQIDRLVTANPQTEVSMCMSRSFVAINEGRGNVHKRSELITALIARDVKNGCEGVVDWYYKNPAPGSADEMTRACVFNALGELRFAGATASSWVASPDKLNDSYRVATYHIRDCVKDTHKKLLVRQQQNRIY